MRASALPSSSAPVVKVIDWFAIIVPLKTLLVPSVAELPTAQKIFFDWAPLASIIWRLDEVLRVEAIWNNCGCALPCPTPMAT